MNMRERNCFLCEEPMWYIEFLTYNCEGKTLFYNEDFFRFSGKYRDYYKFTQLTRSLTKIWQSKYVEIICCYCKEMIETLKNMSAGTMEWMREFGQNKRLKKLKQLGIVVPSDLEGF